MAHGLPADTPAIAVVCTTRPEQQVVCATIADIAARLACVAPAGPVLIMIGQALAQCAERGAQQVGENPAVTQRQVS